MNALIETPLKDIKREQEFLFRRGNCWVSAFWDDHPEDGGGLAFFTSHGEMGYIEELPAKLYVVKTPENHVTENELKHIFAVFAWSIKGNISMDQSHKIVDKHWDELQNWDTIKKILS